MSSFMLRLSFHFLLRPPRQKLSPYLAHFFPEKSTAESRSHPEIVLQVPGHSLTHRLARGRFRELSRLDAYFASYGKSVPHGLRDRPFRLEPSSRSLPD